MIVPAVLFDACVLYPQYLRDILLRLGHPGRGLYAPRWSPLVLDEVERNLVQNAGVGAKRAAAMIALMRTHFPEAEVDPSGDLVASMGNHPKDRHVLAAAVAGNCDLLVTDNVKDFPLDLCRGHGIDVLTADEFLMDIHARDSDWVLETVVRLSTSYHRPPMSPADVAAALRRTRARQFGTTIEAQLRTLAHKGPGSP